MITSFPRGADHEHVVQFAGADEQALVVGVAEFLAAGLQQGQSAMIVAGAERGGAIAERLSSIWGASSAGDSPRVRSLDSGAVGREIVVGGRVDRDRFERVVGEPLSNMRRQAPVRVFGDVVSTLWAEGFRQAAIGLEALWNDAQRRVGFKLYCAYAIDVFSPEFNVCDIDGLLCSHTHVVSDCNSDALDGALDRALDDALGKEAADLKNLMRGNGRPAWAKIPSAESKILWLRNNLPNRAVEILSRARELYNAGVTPAA